MSSQDRMDSRYKRHYFFRSLGLELPTLFTFGLPAKEQPKPAYQKSLKEALSNSAVHLLPILASITAVAMNLKSIYLGRTLEGQIHSASVNTAMLQVTAKLVELLVVASLAHIVVNVIRKELVMGGGVPLGAISGIFMFSSLSYFWSPEFWGSFGGQLPRSVWIRLYGILTLSGLLAAFIGPSIAVLLIPRDQDWQAGGSDIYLRGLANEVWPSDVNFSSISSAPFCAFQNATNYGVCPSGGYLPMLPYRTTSFQIRNYADHRRNLSTFAYGPTQNFIPSIFDKMPDLWLNGNWRSYVCDTSLIGVHGAEAIFLAQLLDDWHQAAMAIPYTTTHSTVAEYKYYDNLRATVPSKAPIVRVACSDAQNITRLRNSMEFPILPDEACWSSTKLFEDAQLNQTPSQTLRTTWLPLPQSFGRVSAGLVLEAPWTSSDSRVVSGCSIDARWADATLSCKSARGNPTVEGAPGTACEALVTDVGPANEATSFSLFRPPTDHSWTPIQLQSSWLDVLTPYIDVENGRTGQSQRVTTLDSLLNEALNIWHLSDLNITETSAWNMDRAGSLNRTVSLEWILATLVADGLSRQGSARVLNSTGDIASWSIQDYKKKDDFQAQLFAGRKPLEQPDGPNLIRKHASILISGYSYKASLFTDYLSIAIVLIYVVLAIFSTVDLLLHGHFSASWDTVTEFLVLLQNSRPATLTLKNTCAGIKELSTYAKLAVIRVSQSDQTVSTSTAVPHLEMIFCEEDQQPVEMEYLLAKSAPFGGRHLITSVRSEPIPSGFEPRNAALSTSRQVWQDSEGLGLRRGSGQETNAHTSKVQIGVLYG